MSEDVNFETNQLNLIWHDDGRVTNETNQDPAIERIEGHSTFWIAADLGRTRLLAISRFSVFGRTYSEDFSSLQSLHERIV